jgi:hypothetical protein
MGRERGWRATERVDRIQIRYIKFSRGQYVEFGGKTGKEAYISYGFPPFPTSLRPASISVGQSYDVVSRITQSIS